LIIDSFMRTEKGGEKDCPNTSMVQDFRSIVAHHYRNIQPIFLYDGDDVQVCLREKNNWSLSVQAKTASVSISMCEYNKRLYISLPLQAKTASVSLSMCEHKKRIYMSLALDEQKKASGSISVCEHKKRISLALSLSLSTSKNRHRLPFLCANKKK